MRAAQALFATMVLIGGGLPVLRLCAQEARSPDVEEYQYVEDTGRWVCMIQGETESFGKLDAAGNFVPDKDFMQLKIGQTLPSLPTRDTPINSPGQKSVYEFRSGRLIPGDLDDKGNFVPKVGGRITDFKDYRYSPKAPKIYNLPGKFVRKEK